MTHRVYLADAMLLERSALSLILLDLNMEIAGAADNWSTTLAELPNCNADMLVADWELLPSASSAALDELRRACPKALVVVILFNLLKVREQITLVGADVFISKGDLPERVAEQLLAAAAKIRT